MGGPFWGQRSNPSETRAGANFLWIFVYKKKGGRTKTFFSTLFKTKFKKKRGIFGPQRKKGKKISSLAFKKKGGLARGKSAVCGLSWDFASFGMLPG